MATNYVFSFRSRMISHSVVSAEDMDSALAPAKDCPVMRVGGGVEVGPATEVPASRATP